MPKITKSVYAKDRKEWRDWLKKNHKKENKVFLIKYKKHTGKPSITHKESMQDAICFGWIDTTVKRIDDERYGNHFAKRTKNSRWSNNTLRYARDLEKQGKMSAFGMKMYREGLKKPVIDHGLPRNPETPKDLIKALGKSSEKFNKLAPSYKRYYIYWIENAKRPETRKKRIKIVTQQAKENKKPGAKLD
jgi:uncharacterized protein YdeI (YjbR/CyaY-like superfamily)